MRKNIKCVIAVICCLLLTGKICAEEITHICTYSYNGSITFTVETQVDTDKLYAADIYNVDLSKVKVTINNSSGKEVNLFTNGISLPGYTITGYDVSQAKKAYIDVLEQTASKSKALSCPTMYLDDQTCKIVKGKNSTDCDKVVSFVPYSTCSVMDNQNSTQPFLILDNDGAVKYSSSPSCQNTALSSATQTCKKDGNSINCNDVKLSDENTIMCTYGNGKLSGKTFIIKYYKDTNEAVFISNDNENIKLADEQRGNLKDGYPVIKSDGLYENFNSNMSSCPTEIICKCIDGKNCYIYDTSRVEKDCGILNKNDGTAVDKNGNPIGSGSGVEPTAPNFEISTNPMNCSEILGSNLTKLVRLCVTAARIIGAIIALLQASMSLFPAIKNGDQGELNKALKKCVSLGIILAIICLLPTFLKLIGNIAGFDISCFF